MMIGSLHSSRPFHMSNWKTPYKKFTQNTGESDDSGFPEVIVGGTDRR